MSAYIAENIPDTVLGYHCALITPQKDKIIGSYLNAYLTSPYGRKFLSYQASGSGQRYTLTVESIGAIPIILPDLDTQKDIGKFFSAIDRKIENNKKISTNIKKAAQTVYNYWFLQFEFPNETGRPYRTSGGKMVWSDVLSRDIPNEWCVKKLSDIAKYRSIAMTKVPIEFYVGVDNMYPNMEGIFESQYAPPASGLKSFETNDILIGNIRPYFKKIWFAGFDGGCNSDVLVVQAKNKSFSPFLYYALANDIFFHYDVAGSKGSKMPRGDKKHIMNYQIAVNEKIMNLFSDFVRPLLNMGNRLDIENRKLNSLRNFILPLLINQQAIFRNG